MYEAISLSSGSTLGFYQLGALHAAESNGKLKSLKIFAGTSVGSIIALLLALGWTAIDIFSYCCSKDVSSVIQLHFDLHLLIEKWGLFNTNKLREYVEKMIKSKCHDKIPTFIELYDEKKKIFICTAYKLASSNSNVYFSYKTHPNMSVLDAVMLSSNIPLVFTAAKYEQDFYLDGGVFCLNPAYYVQREFYESREFFEGEKHSKILSISLDYNGASSITEEDKKMKVSDYIREIVMIPMNNQVNVQSNEIIDNITLSTKSNPIVNLSVNNDTKINWFCSGMEQALKHFEK